MLTQKPWLAQCLFGSRLNKNINGNLPLNKGAIFHTETGPRLMNCPSDNSYKYYLKKKKKLKNTMNNIGNAHIVKRITYGIR